MGYHRLKISALVLLCVASVFLGGLFQSGDLLSVHAEAETPKNTGRLLSGSTIQSVVVGKEYELTCNPKNGNFWVSTLDGQCVYRSNPENPREDPLAKGVTRTNMQSQLLITVMDKKNTMQQLNSAIDCVAEKGLKIYAVAEGMIMEYAFPKLGITIPVEVLLVNDTLQVSIDPTQVKEENEDYKLIDISLFPYFLSAGPEEDGYYLLPDGCGTLMRFHNGKGSAGTYKKLIYDSYRSSSGRFEDGKGQPITLPVYGVHMDNKGGALVVIEEGAALATLNATPAGYKCSYANAYVSFQYRYSKETTLLSRTASEINYWLASKLPISSTEFVVSYTFLDSTENDYVAMADFLRERMFDADSQKINTDAVFLDVYNSVKKLGYTLGIPHQKVYCITSFEQTKQIVSDFSTSDVVLQLYGWNKDGAVGGTICSGYSPAKVSGGKKALADMLTASKQVNASVYLVAELVTYSPHETHWQSSIKPDTQANSTTHPR